MQVCSYCFGLSQQKHLLIFLSIFIFMTGCATSPTLKSVDKIQPRGHQTNLLLMPLDIQFSELDVTGRLVPKANWTDHAKRDIRMPLREMARDRNLELLRYDDSYDPDTKPIEIQLIKLHEAIRSTILQQGSYLPTKKDNFYWTLGSKANILRNRYDADYALFIFIRCNYPSRVRLVYKFFSKILGLLGNQTSGINDYSDVKQFGLISLVDLHSGQIIWQDQTNFTLWDLRVSSNAEKIVTNLTATMPK